MYFLSPDRHPYRPSPDNFLVGPATAAHQVEGNNIHNDWWAHEKSFAPGYSSSGRACDSFNRPERDAQAVENMNCNAYRFSLEWSRIEPNQGQFDESAVQHYIEVINDLIARGIEPVVTIHHFTNPLWFEEEGGWKNPKSVEWFTKFVEYIVPRINGRINIWLTFNEPNVMVQHKYMTGDWYPHEKNMIDPYYSVYPNLIQAHRYAYQIIKKHNPDAQVGITSNFAHLQPIKNIFLPINYYYYLMYSRFSNHYMYRHLKNEMDFIGLNFYTRAQFTIAPQDLLRGKPHIRLSPKPPEKPDDLEFDAHPEDLSQVVRLLAKQYQKPILITENGFVSNNDQGRANYIAGINQELLQLRQETANGLLLFGYLHWSLMDNFEWHLGVAAKFGLHSVDPETFDLIPKPSAHVFADIAREQVELNERG